MKPSIHPVRGPAEHVARIVLNRPETRNAQTPASLRLNEAFDATRTTRSSSSWREGPFSAGHDLRERDTYQHMSGQDRRHLVRLHVRGAKQMAREEIYIGFMSWRNIPKPTITPRAGPVRRGRPAPTWPCDIITAGDDARVLRSCGELRHRRRQFFAHPWEPGPARPRLSLRPGCPPRRRRASAWSPDRAAGHFRGAALAMAQRIATKSLSLKLTKEAVTWQDAQGACRRCDCPRSTSSPTHCSSHDMPIDPAAAGRGRPGARVRSPQT